MHAQLQGKKITPQSFADTVNSEITSILQKSALEILTQIDPQASPEHVQPQIHPYNPPGPTTTFLKIRTKVFSNALYNFTEMPLPLYGKTLVSTTLTRLLVTRTNSNKRKLTFSNNKRKKAGQITRQRCMRPWRYWSNSRTKSWFYVELSPKIQKQSR